MEYAFGSGTMYGRRTGGSATPTPAKFGGLQGVTVDIAHSIKELYGSYQFPLAVARGTAKVTGKAQFAQLDTDAFNDLFFGESSVATGRQLTAVDEQKTVTANTATVTNNTTFVQDLGVVNLTTGLAMNRGAAPAGNTTYSVNESTGVYTFNSAMNNVVVSISYSYNDAANGSKITLANQLLGAQPQFLVVLTETFQGKTFDLQLNACMSSQLSLGFKLEDFMIPDFSFNCFADANGNIGTLSLSE